MLTLKHGISGEMQKRMHLVVFGSSIQSLQESLDFDREHKNPHRCWKFCGNAIIKRKTWPRLGHLSILNIDLSNGSKTSILRSLLCLDMNIDGHHFLTLSGNTFIQIARSLSTSFLSLKKTKRMVKLRNLEAVRTWIVETLFENWCWVLRNYQ